jgi:Cu/Ag efflux pump CusA
VFPAIVSFSLRQRVFVLTAAATLVVWGCFIAYDMPIDLLPETRQPSVIVTVETPGLGAEKTDHLVTILIEMSFTVTALAAGLALVPLLFLMFGERQLTRVIAGNAQLAYDTF